MKGIDKLSVELSLLISIMMSEMNFSMRSRELVRIFFFWSKVKLEASVKLSQMIDDARNFPHNFPIFVEIQCKHTQGGDRRRQAHTVCVRS